MASISINYDEGNTNKYFSIEFKSFKNDLLNRIFNSGNFIKDWYELKKYLSTTDEIHNTDEFIICSSSYDNFLMDTKNYRTMFLICNGDLNNKDDWELTANPTKETYGEFHVLKGSEPTWKEYVNYCTDKTDIELIYIKKYPYFVLKKQISELDEILLSKKFKELKLNQSDYVYIKCDITGNIEFRGKKKEYSIFKIK